MTNEKKIKKAPVAKVRESIYTCSNGIIFIRNARAHEVSDKEQVDIRSTVLCYGSSLCTKEKEYEVIVKVNAWLKQHVWWGVTPLTDTVWYGDRPWHFEKREIGEDPVLSFLLVKPGKYMGGWGELVIELISTGMRFGKVVEMHMLVHAGRNELVCTNKTEQESNFEGHSSQNRTIITNFRYG